MLRQLTARARTRVELERTLARKDVPQEAAAAVLDRMVDVGLVDDEKFAAAWVESRQQRRHLSRSVLRQELRRKGVEADTVNAATEPVDAEAEHAAARALAEKKLRSLGRYPPDVRRRRLAGVLARRGFGPSISYAVLAELRLDEDDSAGPM